MNFYTVNKMLGRKLTIYVFFLIEFIMIKVHYALADVPSKIFTIEIQSKTTCGEFLLLLCEKEKKVYHILFFEGSQVDMQDQIIDYISNQYCVFIASLTDDIPSKEFIDRKSVV